MGALLTFNGVCAKYKDRQVIDNLTFSLKKGEVIALLGPSGCGKTTILNITSGLLKESAGEVEINTKDLGYVFQEPRLLPWKTVLDNVLFVIKGKEKMKKKRRALEILELVGLRGFSNFYPSQLSGGMKQRVSIARALASDPKIILMDEPFSALDPELKSELQNDLIQLIERQHTSIIYVTHDPEEAIKLADRVLVFSCQGCAIQHEVKIEVDRRKRDYQFIQQMEYDLKLKFGGVDYEAYI